MKPKRVTSGMVQRREWGQPWAERVPKELLILGQAYLEIVRLVLREKRLRHDSSADWETLYKRPLATEMRGLLRLLAPDEREFPTPPSADPEPSVDDWVKKVARYITRLDTEGQACSPQKQAQLTQYAHEHLSGLRSEIRACLDIVATLVVFQTHPAVLIEKARTGDPDALEQLLEINPSLEDRPWVRDRLADLVGQRGFSGSGRWQQAITDGLQIRKSKLLEIGCMLTLLWPMLCRLTTDQRRGYLKALGLTSVPTKKALREFERRLNLKSVMERPLSPKEQKVLESMC